MKKKIITIIISAVLAVAMMLTLVACNENYKQDAVATDLTNKEVSSNGGLAVQVGKYLYFINGYAAATGENTFGQAVKGAIMRVELNAGVPNLDTLVTIVPKNVYNTNKAVGLTVYGDYLYYTSPSTSKGSDGQAKTSDMWIMRTKLDGTDTQVVLKLDNYTTNFRLAGGYLVYLDAEYNLHSIDLNSKKLKDEVVVEEISSAMLTYTNLDSDMGGIFFVKRAEDKSGTNNEIWVYANGTTKKVIDGKNSYEASTLPHKNGYNLSISDVQKVGDKVRLIYAKTDSGTNATSKGDYYYDFDGSYTFSQANEVRMTSGVNYTAYKFFDGANVLATDSDSIDYLRNDGNAWVSDTVIKASSASLMKVEIKDNAVYATYLASNVVYSIKILDKNNTGYEKALGSAKTVFNSKFSADWQGLDMVGSCVYFFNSDVKNNAYYLDLNAVIDRSNNSMIATKLGKFSAEDNYALLESATENK